MGSEVSRTGNARFEPRPTAQQAVGRTRGSTRRAYGGAGPIPCGDVAKFGDNGRGVLGRKGSAPLHDAGGLPPAVRTRAGIDRLAWQGQRDGQSYPPAEAPAFGAGW